MPVSTSTGAVTAGKPLNSPEGQPSGAVRAADFAVCDNDDATKQVRIATTGIAAGTAVTITAPPASGTIAVSGVNAMQYSAPATGATVAIATTTRTLIVNPAGTIAALTLTWPPAADGKTVTVSSSQIITSLTNTPDGSDTIKNDATAMTAGGVFTFTARSGVWYRG